jgi:hypothetical protein
MIFLQFGRNPTNILVRFTDIKTLTRSVTLRQLFLRTYQNELFTESYQEHEQALFDSRWISLRNALTE